jgi:hypothetical protein
MAELFEGRVVEPVKQLAKYGANSPIKVYTYKTLYEDRKFVVTCVNTRQRSTALLITRLLWAVEKLLYGNKKWKLLTYLSLYIYHLCSKKAMWIKEEAQRNKN